MQKLYAKKSFDIFFQTYFSHYGILPQHPAIEYRISFLHSLSPVYTLTEAVVSVNKEGE